MKKFSERRVDALTSATARFLLRSAGMTILPRDSDVVGAAVLLAILLATGIRALVM
jgi:hypothetical protein